MKRVSYGKRSIMFIVQFFSRWLAQEKFRRVFLPTGSILFLTWIGIGSGLSNPVRCQSPSAEASADLSLEDVLTDKEWNDVDESVERALAWLAKTQQPDGSFPTLPTGQPGVTSLCVLAFMAHGHVPDTEPYGKNVERALDYILGCQKENGLIMLVGSRGPEISRELSNAVGIPAAYNHAIAAVTLSELYGMSSGKKSEDIERVLTKALDATLTMQRWPKIKEEEGGWRYVNIYDEHDSDLSVTSWQLMFLRSAGNAGFDVPEKSVNDAVAFIRRCFNKEYGTLEYVLEDTDTRSRGMAGAGILALAHAGYHNSAEANAVGDWLLDQDFETYNNQDTFGRDGYSYDRYHYGVFTCCQGMYQLGGRRWKEFFPPVVRTVLANQQPGGYWPVDTHMHDSPYGSHYTTALMVIALGSPNQLISIFQR